MRSRTTAKFWDSYHKLPSDIREKAKKAYKLFEDNPSHPGLRFKKVASNPPTYSVRISQACRALGVKDEDVIIWFWIGMPAYAETFLKRMSNTSRLRAGRHDDYERLIADLS